MYILLFSFTLSRSKPYVLEVTHSPTQSVKSIGLNASIQKALQHIWNLDHNRLTPDKDYVINVQKGKKPYQKFDGASDPLFTSVERSAFQRPTYRTFIALLDNYVAEVGNDDTISSHERREIWSFIRAIMQTVSPLKKRKRLYNSCYILLIFK